MSGADNGVAFPITKTALACDNSRTFADIDSIGDQAMPAVLTAARCCSVAVPSKQRDKVPPRGLFCQIIWYICS